MVSIGIDIGTTTICAVAAEVYTGRIIKTITRKNSFFTKTENSYERLQNAEGIAKEAESILSEIISEFHDVKSIGVTGQMHGIVYVGADGIAVSPLYTWQDGRGNLEYKGDTYAGVLSKLTNTNAATGFGLTTHFYNLINSLVPASAFKLCTVQDYVGARLTGTMPLMHISNAASLGIYNFESRNFSASGLDAAGIEQSILPEVTDDFQIIGKHCGIPVCVAVGDNQASFIGSVNSDDCVLVNVGTGSQVSVIAGGNSAPESAEIRPLYGNTNLLVGSSLCGGRAYQLLSDFFKQCVTAFSGACPDNIYKLIDNIAENETVANPVEVSTLFNGTRKNPSIRGSIENIGTDNFTPQSFIMGTLSGMEKELHTMCSDMLPYSKSNIKRIVGSGNGIRRNAPLRRLIEAKFGMPLVMPQHCEEASYGAMLCSLVSCGIYKTIDEAQEEMIKYSSERRL